MIQVSLACDSCEKKDLSATRTNLPISGKLDAPMPDGGVWWIRLREGDGGHREIHWHFCSEACLAKWASKQAEARAPRATAPQGGATETK